MFINQMEDIYFNEEKQLFNLECYLIDKKFKLKIERR